MEKVKVEEIFPVKRAEEENWGAKFKVELANSQFKPIRRIEFNGYFTGEGQRYFWGFGPTQDEKGWVLRLDFFHFEFRPGIDYKIGSGGFSVLLVEGGSLMISGGRAVEGIMRIDEMQPHEGRLQGTLLNVKAEGGRPDGSDMDPAYASVISFVSSWEK
ncbi:hypothetical protein PGC34_11055 [Pseudomonas kribbensis]|uniref:hypothetical protein n=1 Tax=Pseudomonas kribbensis TaxID=1628086 RepID=UPI003BF81BB4